MNEVRLQLDELMFSSVDGVSMESVEVTDTVLRVEARTTVGRAACPGCGCWSGRIHGSYLRFPRDLPAVGKFVLVSLRVRRFVCAESSCPRKTFAEQVPGRVAGHSRTILAGGSEQAAASINAAADDAGLRPGSRKGIDDAVGYLTNKAAYLRYDTALTEGFPIATGIIEGACRHLVKDRLDITGARWGLSGAEAVLKLRALRSNGDFDTYWAWHETQEFTRNHQARYRDTLIPAA